MIRRIDIVDKDQFFVRFTVESESMAKRLVHVFRLFPLRKYEVFQKFSHELVPCILCQVLYPWPIANFPYIS